MKFAPKEQGQGLVEVVVIVALIALIVIGGMAIFDPNRNVIDILIDLFKKITHTDTAGSIF